MERGKSWALSVSFFFLFFVCLCLWEGSRLVFKNRGICFNGLNGRIVFRGTEEESLEKGLWVWFQVCRTYRRETISKAADAETEKRQIKMSSSAMSFMWQIAVRIGDARVWWYKCSVETSRVGKSMIKQSLLIYQLEMYGWAFTAKQYWSWFITSIHLLSLLHWRIKDKKQLENKLIKRKQMKRKVYRFPSTTSNTTFIKSWSMSEGLHVQ